MTIPKSRAKASRALPLAVCLRAPGRAGYARAAPVEGVVKMVRVAVPGVPWATLTELGLKLNVGRSWAPAGREATTAVNITSPVKPLTDVTVIVEVLPVVAPGLTETAVPAIVKPGVCAAETVRAMVVVANKLPEVPVMVTVLGPPTVAELLAVSVSRLVPLAGFVPKAAVTPLGKPVAASVTLPVKPPAGVTVIVLVPLPPWAMLMLLGAADSLKLGLVTVTVAVPVAGL